MVNNNPLVSVIIPMYNTEEYVAQCIDSLLNQTYKNIEIIIIDDNSNDKSSVIVENYCNKYDNIIYRRHDVNKGPMVARQEGVELSNGQYVFFVDSDDWLPLNAIDDMLLKQRISDADIVVGDMVRITNDGIIEKRFHNVLKYGEDVAAIMKSLFNGEVQHVLCGKLFRKELFSYSYIVYENMINSEDALMFYQMIENVKKMVCTENVVYFYRRTPNSSSNREFSEQQILNYFTLYKYLYENVIGRYPGNLKELNLQFFNSLVDMLKKGYNKKIISNFMLPVLDIDTCFSTRYIIRNSQGLYKFYNLMLFTFAPFRLISKYLYRITHRR